MEWYTYSLVDHEIDSQTGQRHNVLESKYWVNWVKSVFTYLYTVLNERDIHWIYVVHKRNRTADNVINIDEEILWNDLLQGPAFTVDIKTVLILFK